MLLVKDADPSWWAAGEMLEGFPTPDQVKSWWESENRVDIVDSTEKEVEKAIDKPNSVSTASVDKRVDMSTPMSTGEVDTENAIGMPNSNGKSLVSIVSTLFEGLGEKVDYKYSEDE